MLFEVVVDPAQLVKLKYELEKIIDVELDSAIKNGAIILQTSLDGFKWVTSSTKTNLVQSSGSYTFQNDINELKG